MTMSGAIPVVHHAYRDRLPAPPQTGRLPERDLS
jgi:hypothetical protein